MAHIWYKKVMKAFEVIDAPIDLHDLPTLAKQSSEVEHLKISSLRREESIEIPG